MKIIGFNQGQIGDLALNMIACRVVKETHPGCHLTFSINKKYASAAPLFLHNPLIDDIKIWDGYDNWPTREDLDYMDANPFDLFFQPCPKVTDERWYLSRHHSEEVCRMHGLTPPKNLQVNLTRYFDLIPDFKHCVAIAPYTSAGSVRDIPESVSLKIIDFIHSLGLQTIQLGLKSHKQLPTTFPIQGGTVFNDVKIALSCKMMITADTGINYLMSGYEHRVLGLYSTNCYPVVPVLKNRAPWNKNAIFLEGREIVDIPENSIYNSIKAVLTLCPESSILLPSSTS